MTEELEEGAEAAEETVDFGDDATLESTTGYKRYGAEEDSTPKKEEPAKEEVKDLEEEPKDEEEEEEPGDEEESEEEEEDHGLPKVSKELEPERKQLIKALSDKHKQIGAIRVKAALVDAIDKNPEETLRMLADRYQIDLGQKAEAKAKETAGIPDLSKIQPGEDELLPSYIQRLLGEAFKGLPEMIKQGVTGAMPKAASPQQGHQDSVTAALKHLDENYSDWGLYEEKMIDMLFKDPRLSSDPDKLYKDAKAASVGVRKVAKAKKTAKKVTTVKSGARSSKQVKVATPKGKIMSFNEAWELSKQQLRGK